VPEAGLVRIRAPFNRTGLAFRKHGEPEGHEKSIRHVFTALWVVIVFGCSVANAQTVINVSTAAGLQSAVSAANAAGGNRIILLADGTYTVTSTLNITAPNVTVAGQPGHRASVIIQGDAMSATASIGNVIRADASNFTLHDVTVQRSGWHAIQVVGEDSAQSPVIRDCILRDTYEQLLKVSQDPTKPNVDSNNGLVENCIFEYTAGIGPEYYIGGIDAHGSQNWVVRGNTFMNIISPNTTVAEFAVHFWDLPSANNLVEKNTIVNCDRGVGFGLDGRGNSGGIIRNNMIYHDANDGQFADSAISLTDSPNSQVYNNTILMLDSFPWAIDYRYSDTTGVLIENNATNLPIVARDGATGTVGSNVTNAGASWFVAPASGNLHLTSAIPALVDKGVAIPGLTDDFDGTPRPQGAGYDIGAQEWAPVRPDPPTNLQVQ
jgi:Right handed beta helix region